jgi:hypothetical protein
MVAVGVQAAVGRVPAPGLQENAELAHAGQPPSSVQLADEKRAAAAVERARDELLAAVSHLNPAELGVSASGTHG